MVKQIELLQAEQRELATITTQNMRRVFSDTSDLKNLAEEGSQPR